MKSSKHCLWLRTMQCEQDRQGPKEAYIHICCFYIIA